MILLVDILYICAVNVKDGHLTNFYKSWGWAVTRAWAETRSDTVITLNEFILRKMSRFFFKCGIYTYLVIPFRFS